MGLPSIVIEFIKKAVQTIKQGAGGIVGIILKDSVHNGSLIIKGVDEIPTDFSKGNQEYIQRAFEGAPKKVIVYTLPTEAESYAEALKYFAITAVNYLVGAPDISPEEAQYLATWCKSIRKNTTKRPVVIVPKVKADAKCVIDFEVVGASENDCINVGDKHYTEAQYCSRIAGLIAGLDLKVSATYKPLSEVDSIPVVDKEEVDKAVDEGKLTLYNDGERIVIARGVTSLVNVTETETEDLKKIKILAIQDLIETDIYSTINKSYVGNYSNSYDNKQLLVTAIKAYLGKLSTDEGGKGYINSGYSMEISVAKQKAYLEGQGKDTSEMTEQEIKEANTGSYVGLAGKVSILDAMEDVDITITKE